MGTRAVVVWAATVMVAGCQGSTHDVPFSEVEQSVPSPREAEPADGGTASEGEPVDGGGALDGGAPEAPITLGIWTSEGGSARVTQSGFECADECEQQFPEGAEVTVVALPEPGFDFVGWEGPCVGTNGCVYVPTETCRGTGDCMVTLHEKTLIVGRFERRHRISVTVRGEGSVRSEPVYVHQGALVCPAECSKEFREGQRVRLVATPTPGWRFEKWEGACTGGECQLVMSEDVELTATFVRQDEALPAACSTLLPARLKDPVSVMLPQGPCDTGTSDGAGRFALGYQEGDGPTFPRAWFYDVQDDRAVRVGDWAASSDEFQLRLFPLESGFMALSGNGPGKITLSSYSSGGGLVGSETLVEEPPLGGWTDALVAANPATGGVVVVRTYYLTHPSGAERVGTIQPYGSSGKPAGDEVEIARDVALTAVGVSAQGTVLVVANLGDHSTPRFATRWFSTAGESRSDWSPLTESLGEKLATGHPTLEPLQDGALVLKLLGYGTHTPTIAATFTEDGGDQVPAWLKRRPAARAFPIRDGQGYAVTRGAPCGDMIEVLTREGESCGCVHGESFGPQTNVGLDGSVIAPQLDFSYEQCRYDLYPALLE